MWRCARAQVACADATLVAQRADGRLDNRRVLVCCSEPLRIINDALRPGSVGRPTVTLAVRAQAARATDGRCKGG